MSKKNAPRSPWRDPLSWLALMLLAPVVGWSLSELGAFDWLSSDNAPAWVQAIGALITIVVTSVFAIGSSRDAAREREQVRRAYSEQLHMLTEDIRNLVIETLGRIERQETPRLDDAVWNSCVERLRVLGLHTIDDYGIAAIRELRTYLERTKAIANMPDDQWESAYRAQKDYANRSYLLRQRGATWTWVRNEVETLPHPGNAKHADPSLEAKIQQMRIDRMYGPRQAPR